MREPDATGGPPPDQEPFAIAQALIESRQNITPKHLVEPGPSTAQVHAMLSLAAAAPDHGQLTPWRFVLVPPEQRHRLADVFASALVDRDPGATEAQVADARGKAHRAPLLMVAIASLGSRNPDTPALERMVSMGAAIQNLLLGAHAMGFGTGLTSGRAMASPHMRRLCGLKDGEVAVCCINIGTVARRKAATRVRPDATEIFSVLEAESPPDGA